MATTPFSLPLTIVKGITYGPVIFQFKQEDLTPFDFTDGGVWKVFAYARRSKDAKNKIDLNPLITDAVNGEVRISFTDEQTLAFMAGEYGWDLVLEMPTGQRLGPYFDGKLKITEINTHI
jgi:hypothetical protein